MSDVDYHRRLEWLSELMELHPDKPVRKLQREALKYYPLYYKESIRHWMSMRIAFKAAEITNRRMLERLACPIPPYHPLDLWI